MKTLFSVVLVCATVVLYGQDPIDNWDVFARVNFVEKLITELNEYYLVPQFDARIKEYEGKDFIIAGHYVPFDLVNEDAIVLSKYPYAQCFFCGGAGPESVVEVVFISGIPTIKFDQFITIKGKLRLNAVDVNHLNFILEDAKLIKD